MEDRRNKKHIIIASKHFLNRLGIKTVLSVIGLEAEIYEMSDFEKIKDSVTADSGVDFILLCEDILPEDNKEVMKHINDGCSQKRIMVIGGSELNKYPNLFFVNNTGGRKEVLDQFQSFFYDRDLKENADESLLTEREIEVLRKVAQGNANKEIADKLFISINTVITHRKNITEKLGIKTIAGLTVYAIMNGVINPEEVKY